MSGPEPSLDDPKVNVKEYFKRFIKPKKIDELIAADNKLFSEVRNLESEKHVLVTQNYKKFVSATETINTIKSSLINFENDLLNLQGKVQNLVLNFNKINAPLEGKLKQTEDIYKIKKDLKRLKFINDLPSILEKQLNEYIKDPEKKLTTLEKSLTYYEKCKEFLKIHKDNALVKDIYTRTKDLIYNYKTYINDKMNVAEFNEFEIENFEKCLSLLVKIEDDKKDLIKIFIDRYQYLITCQYDKLFSTKDDVEEISFETYNKIYDNYEFAIKEDDFLFYENEIKNREKNLSLNQIPNSSSMALSDFSKKLNLSSLASKFLKKGTFIWICKKVCENILSQLMVNCYNSYKSLFGEDTTDNINTLFNQCVSNFNQKIKNTLDKVKEKNQPLLDPEFFRDGLYSFHKAFNENLLSKVQDEKINGAKYMSDISENNKNLLNIYFVNMHEEFIKQVTSKINNSLEKIIKFNKSIYDEANSESFIRLNKNLFQNEVNIFYKYIEELFLSYSKQIKSLGLESFNKDEFLGAETSQLYINHLMSVFALLILVLHSSNKVKFRNNEYEKYFISFNKVMNFKEIIENYKEIINTNFAKWKDNYELIYFFIFFIKKCKEQINNMNPIITTNINNMTDKFLFEYPILKKDKKLVAFFNDFINKELTQCYPLFFDAIILLENKKIFDNLKKLFFEPDWLKVDKTPVTFRLELKKYCYQLYQLKLNLNDVLEEESNKFKEAKKTKIITDNSYKNKSQVQLEMEKLQIRRMTIYGEVVSSPQEIIYILVKIFLKTLNEFIKIKKYNLFAYQQIQIDVSFIHSFLKENLVYYDSENIMDGFLTEILMNASVNTNNYEANKVLTNEFIGDLLNMHKNEFEGVLKKIQDANVIINLGNNEGQ
jgi:hypothetical protein